MDRSVSHVPVLDVIGALAFVGDLSMGQPVDHSLRTAWLACQLAAAAGGDASTGSSAATVALLRWSGCTANAPEFSELLGDDVQGRRVMLAETSAAEAARFAGTVTQMTRIHCEVSGDIARTLDLSTEVETSLRCIFENHDGTGQPRGLPAELIPHEVFFVSLAGDLEILSRTYGFNDALRYIAERADRRYPASLVKAATIQAAQWMDALDQGAASLGALGQVIPRSDQPAPLELLADVIDLKVPWMAGLSRRVASTALHCAQVLGLDDLQQHRVYRAGLIHGIGRASVPNSVWESPGKASEADTERLRLVPYWTDRAARRIDALKEEAGLASFIEERLDGSGGFRGVSASAIGIEARVLAAALRWVWLQTERPAAAALSADESMARLRQEAQAGAFDASVVAALAGEAAATVPARQAEETTSGLLTQRELEVLRRIGGGESNKEAARTLGISPSTVRAHLESIFRKLECTTRAAATLKAFTLGLL
ncbi:HD domain-containing phosphohydrolase [Piscinibacter terrae]|uniref:LuxR family transcriptional regulator n=1 Tax=Piscinibacter terrae TaxID=2496871 RepID=A0A3N7JR63_9BURK|nr:HD domain-containing phosphohydrolase [Albitalea terrae]RQP23499.1 LuxR family transcriptional regulator [Albitalea terrae]